MDTASDDDLLQAYARGDAQAFERLYARHQAGLYRFIRRLLGQALAAQADEVYQDTWMRVVQARGPGSLRAVPAEGERAPDTTIDGETAPADPAAAAPPAPGGRGPAQFRTWLYTLAHHRVIDLWRRSGREVSLDADDGTAPWEPDGPAWQHWPAPAHPAPSADELMFWRRAGERLLHCLEALPLPQRSTFLLHHDDGLPLADVAQALGVGFETAKTRLRYAMVKLRGCMGAHLAPGEGGWA